MGLTTVAKGTGVYGGGTTAAGGDQIGVRGETRSRVGVQGTSFGEGIAIEGHSLSGDKGLAGRFVGNVHIQGNPGTSSGDLRVEGTSSFGGNATFQGNIDVAGDIRLLNADVAEEFSLSVAESVQPGTVMVIGEDGTLQSSTRAYDKCVAGVVSGGGALKPAIILDKRCEGDSRRVPIAMVGKVSCKVDAQYSPIQVGDLLTTSATPGHAMRASDPSMAFGSVIGKALARLEVGQGTIPILIALQ